MKTLIIASIILTLVGCAGGPARMAMLSDTELQSAGFEQLCHSYRYWGSEKYLEPLKIRTKVVKRYVSDFKPYEAPKGLTVVERRRAFSHHMRTSKTYGAHHYEYDTVPLFTDDEIYLIRKGSIRVGMSLGALKCSKGPHTDVSFSSYGPTQYVYRPNRYSTTYVYVKGDKVVDWSN